MLIPLLPTPLLIFQTHSNISFSITGMHFGDGSRLSIIETAPQDNNDDSIINQLNMLENGFESKVTKIESFLYAQEQPHSPYKLKDSYLPDMEGEPITPISSKHLPENPFTNRNRLPSKRYFNKEQDKKELKQSIRDEIMQQNLLLQRRLTQNKHYPSALSQKAPSNDGTDKEGIQKEAHLNEIGRLEELYNRSKVVKLYNFILREVPHCTRCDKLKMHLAKNDSGVSLKCRGCEQDGHPLIGVLYDLENKGRFEEETSIYQAALDGITVQLNLLQEKSRQLQVLRQKITMLKHLNRKKYKQINESKFYLRKHLENLQQSHFIELQRLIPREYLQQLDIWTDIKENHSNMLAGSVKSLIRIIPAHLQPFSLSRLLDGLKKLLNYEKQQAVKISVSQAMEFPLKRVECAVFLVDGSYSLPVFEDVQQLKLEFQNKKTQRQLNLLFSSLPRQVHSLAFSYNHKTHSHISAENFPFLRFLAGLPALNKVKATILNVKDFSDLLELATTIAPKTQLGLTVTKHLYSKANLILPLHYYSSLFSRLGNQITKIQLDLPQSSDSIAQIDYNQLLSLPYLCSFSINRGGKQRNINILQAQEEHQEELKKRLLKRTVNLRSNLVRTIRNLSSLGMSETEIKPILMFLL